MFQVLLRPVGPSRVQGQKGVGSRFCLQGGTASPLAMEGMQDALTRKGREESRIGNNNTTNPKFKCCGEIKQGGRIRAATCVECNGGMENKREIDTFQGGINVLCFAIRITMYDQDCCFPKIHFLVFLDPQTTFLATVTVWCGHVTEPQSMEWEQK